MSLSRCVYILHSITVCTHQPTRVFNIACLFILAKGGLPEEEEHRTNTGRGTTKRQLYIHIYIYYIVLLFLIVVVLLLLNICVYILFMKVSKVMGIPPKSSMLI